MTLQLGRAVPTGRINFAVSQTVPSQTPPSSPDRVLRWMVVVVIVLVSALFAVGAGLLARAGGASVPIAILTGGGAFVTVTGLLLSIGNFVVGGRR